MTQQGDPQRGRQLFTDELRLACSRCHTTDGRGGKAGPDLSSIGDKFGRRDLIESILSPSATIAVGYSTTVIETRSGDAFVGVVKDVTDERIVLVGGDGQTIHIPTRDIRRQRTSNISLMPDGLHTGLTLQEFTDIIDYLASLKAPQTAAAIARGMPAEIGTLKNAVALNPINGPNLQFEHPTWFSPLPGVPGTLAVVEHDSGKIWLFEEGNEPATKKLFLDTGKFNQGTRGLLGMAFHPDYSRNRRYFIAKHVVENGRFSTYLREGNANSTLKCDSGQPLIQILKFEASTDVHYGGGLEFGPDGCLYVGMGDTGPQQDPRGNGQNMELLLGKMLRIDVDHPAAGRPYSVPRDNPFVGHKSARPEIWACGFREPWRYSFDPLTADLWVGDVGQDLYEEVAIVRRGENHGWNVFEGFQPFSNLFKQDGQTYTPPVFAYGRRFGVSVTGGHVYRADPDSSFYGVYIFGDYESKRIFGLTQQNRVLTTIRQIGTAPQRIVSFGKDERGQLYIVGYEGTIYRMDLSHARFE